MTHTEFKQLESQEQFWVLVEMEKEMVELSQTMSKWIEDFNTNPPADDYYGDASGDLSDALSEHADFIDGIREDYVEKYQIYIETRNKEQEEWLQSMDLDNE